MRCSVGRGAVETWGQDPQPAIMTHRAMEYRPRIARWRESPQPPPAYLCGGGGQCSINRPPPAYLCGGGAGCENISPVVRAPGVGPRVWSKAPCRGLNAAEWPLRGELVNVAGGPPQVLPNDLYASATRSPWFGCALGSTDGGLPRRSRTTKVGTGSTTGRGPVGFPRSRLKIQSPTI